MEIFTVQEQKALKVVVYGVEGVGKTLFASKFPDAVFIDIEGSTAPYKKRGLRTFKKPGSWAELLSEVEQVAYEKPCKTLVIDTLDWAQNLCVTKVCDANHWKSIESPGYGTGYRVSFEEYQNLLNALDRVIDAGINVVCNAHAMITKFEAPDEAASYNRYQMKLIDTPKCSIPGMVKEWADIVLFANFKDIVMTDSKTKRTYAQGGQKRVMYSTRTAVWDAKNRYDLPDEMDLDFKNIAHLFEGQANPVPETKPLDITDHMDEPPMIHEVPVEKPTEPTVDLSQYKGLPDNLISMLVDNHITADMLKRTIADEGIVGTNVEFSEYPKDFIDGYIIAGFSELKEKIFERESLPF